MGRQKLGMPSRLRPEMVDNCGPVQKRQTPALSALMMRLNTAGELCVSIANQSGD